MNTNHMIVRLSAVDSGSLLILKTYEPGRGSSSCFYVSAARFGSWLEESEWNRTPFYDADLNSFLKAYREDKEHVSFTVSWIRVDGFDDARGYVQRFRLSTAFIKAVMLTGDEGKALADIGGETPQARICLAPSAQEQVARIASDKLLRRALCKALKRNFFWRNSHVTIYADFDRSFFFRDETMSGGLILHSSTVVGKDGMLREGFSYAIHT